MNEHLKHDQKSDWDQDVPSGPLFRGGPAKIAVDVFRVAMVVAVGLVILPFKVFAALAAGAVSEDRGGASLWDGDILDGTDSGMKLYEDPDAPGGLGGAPVYPDQEPYSLG